MSPLSSSEASRHRAARGTVQADGGTEALRAAQRRSAAVFFPEFQQVSPESSLGHRVSSVILLAGPESREKRRMNVACPACPAKYAVPDEKVRGKKARITCKRCGSAIIIDGTTLNQASKPPPKPKLEPLPPPPEAMSAPEAAEDSLADGWLVAITDERQEPASTNRIVALYASGTIDAETFLWREGMAEWQTAFEIPEIAAALEARGLSHRVIEPGVESMPSRIPTYDDDEATHIGRPNTLGAQTAPVASGWTEPGRWGGGRENESQAYDDDLTMGDSRARLLAARQRVPG